MELFPGLVGNDHIKKYLTHMVQHEKVGNAFLFAGTDGIGKSCFAKALAKVLICGDKDNSLSAEKFEQGNHPDFHQYYPEGKIGMHSMDTMRRFKQEVYLPPYEAPWQVFVIHDADRMLPYSSNALLKTFEEPPKNTIIILLSSSPSSFLPTVLSRCRKVFFHPLSEQDVVTILIRRGVDQEKSILFAKRSQGSVSKALRLAEKGEDPLIEKLLQFLLGNDWLYEKIKEVTAHIGEELDAYKLEIEQEATEALGGENLKDLSAVQREQVEKEIQGVVTMQYHNAVEGLFQTILGWYRDIQLYHAGGDPGQLLLPVTFEQLPPPGQSSFSLFKIHKMIEEAHLAMIRFVPIASVLETLLLKLSLN